MEVGLTEIKVNKFEYRWVINNISYIKKESSTFICSPKFYPDPEKKLRCRLRLYLNGYSKDVAGWVSISLCINADEYEDITVHSEFSILSSNESKQLCKQNSSNFGKNFPQRRSLGQKTYVEYKKLMDEKAGLVKNHSLTLLCTIHTASDTSIHAKEQSNTLSIEDRQNQKLQEFETFNRLFEEGLFSDLNLIAGDKKLKAHRCILSSRSAYFSKMLLNENCTNKSIIDIKDIEFHILKEAVRFIYTGEVVKLDEYAYELIAVACKFELPGLKKLCEQSLIKNLNVNNVWKVLLDATLYNAKKLKDIALKFIIFNKEKVIVTKEFDEVIDLHPRLMGEVFRMMGKPIKTSEENSDNEASINLS